MSGVRLLLLAPVLSGFLAGCGASAGPPANAPRPGKISRSAASSAQVKGFDPAGALVKCLRGEGLHARQVSTTEVRVAPERDGVRIVFAGTPGEADTAQLQGRAEGAEVVGRAVLYVGTANDTLLTKVEKCVNEAGLQT